MNNWKKFFIGEICEIKRGKRITKNDLIEKGKYLAISGGKEPFGRIDKFNRDENTITIAQYGSAGYVNFQTERFWANDVCYSIFPNLKILNNKYLYYYLKNIQNYIYTLVTDAIPSHLPVEKLNQIEICIPPIEEQNKIVEILDKFTNYKAELTAELTFREEQYKYYRDKLLNNLGCVEYKPLLDISLNIFSGGTPQTSKKEYYNGDIFWLRSGEIKFGPINKTEIKITKLGLNNSSAKLIRPHSIVIALTGATVARVGWTEIETSSNQSVCAIEINPNVNYKFVYYFLESQYNNLKSKSKGALSSLTNNFIKNYQIPIPSIEVQNKIAEILDKFNSLINNISEGMPKEIQLRDKQYNYYRNLLLDFEDK